MTGLMRTRALITVLMCALALAIAAAPAGAAASESRESQQMAEQQIAARQIASAKINRRIARVHLVLKDGTHVYFHYGKGERPNVEAALTKKHIPLTVLTPSAAKKEESKQPHKHKLRYIAGGALIVIVLIVGGVLLYNRRRQSLAE